MGQPGGIMIYQSMSGDAATGTGNVTINGGTYNATAGPAFYITNTDSNINLIGVNVTCASGTLIKAAGGSQWGTNGTNGGIANFTADHETLNGSLVADSISSIAVTPQNGSTRTCAITNASLTLDATSTWSVTGNSTLTALTDPSGISGSTITNIIGNGYTVTYDQNLTQKSSLDGKTCTLTNGGTLTPA